LAVASTSDTTGTLTIRSSNPPSDSIAFNVTYTSGTKKTIVQYRTNTAAAAASCYIVEPLGSGIKLEDVDISTNKGVVATR
jgi:hypothetical protein